VPIGPSTLRVEGSIMKKAISAVVVSVAVVAMLLPVVIPVNLSISNVPHQGQVLLADGGPDPVPGPKPPVGA